MKFENTYVYGFWSAIHGMRMPMKSFAKSDSELASSPADAAFLMTDEGFALGEKDKGLAQRLIGSGPEHCKFLRDIDVWTDITAPSFVNAEIDTYKVGTTRNSSSFMHLGMKNEFVWKDFDIKNPIVAKLLDAYPDYFTEGAPHIDSVRKVVSLNDDSEDIVSDYIWWVDTIRHLNQLRDKYLETKDNTIFERIREELPSGYKYTFSWHANYAVLRNMYFQRRYHRLADWSVDFVKWIESLPYSKELIMYEKENR